MSDKRESAIMKTDSKEVTESKEKYPAELKSNTTTKTQSFDGSIGSKKKSLPNEETTELVKSLSLSKEHLKAHSKRSSATMSGQNDLEKKVFHQSATTRSGGDSSQEFTNVTDLVKQSQEEMLANFDLINSASPKHSISSVIQSANEKLPNLGHDLKYTKMFLQKQGINNLSIWSHLTDVLNKIIAEQPDNVIDYFEEYSRKVKEEKLILYDSLRDIFIPPAQLESAQNQLTLINAYGIKEDDAEEPEAAGEDEEKVEPPKKMDLEEAAFYFRQAGIALPDIQLVTLNIAMKKLTEEKQLVKLRFWGKILGIKQDYFVVECELTDEEYGRRVEEELEEAERIAAEKAAAAEEGAAEEAEGEKLESEEKGSRTEEFGGDEVKEDVEAEHTNEEKTEATEQEEEESKGKLEVTFDIPSGEDKLGEEEEQEDPLLPPLPLPRKLLKYKIPPLLKPVEKEVTEIPTEKLGEGLNRKIYFVTNTPELEWSELPKVTPDEINVARQIKVSLTGDLESQIFTYPSFPGSEKNYLRAQIARISAATHVSPIGFYRTGEKGEEEEEEEEVPEEEEEGGGDKTKFTENPKFQPIPIKDLIDPSLASWVHHGHHILKQGRAVWWSAKKAGADEEEAEEEQEEEEEEEGKEGEEKETGPPLLNPLSEDATIEGNSAWTVRKTHNYNAEMAAAVIRSNLWPGACAFAVGKKFENIYFGWGHKHLPYGFSPSQLPHPEYEYDLGPEIMEIQDPTVEVEEAWRQAHKKKPPPAEGEEGEGEEGEEEEEEEDDD